MSSANPSADRCQDLYELSKKITKKEDKNKDDILLEKEKEQYTFSPNLEKDTPVESGELNAGLIEETIERLKKGREERERQKASFDRGGEDSGMRFGVETNKFKKESSEIYSGSKKLSTASSKVLKPSAKKEGKKEAEAKKKEEKAEELNAMDGDEMLYIDVNLGDKQERIVVHKGDIAPDLAANFAAEHG